MVKSFRFTRAFDICLGTFHTIFLVLLAVLFLYAGGNIAGILQSLNTLIGTGIFLLLWATTWYCTQRAAKEIRVGDSIVFPTRGNWLWAGMKWGAVNGVVFFLFLLFIGLALFIVLPTGPTPDSISALETRISLASCIGIFALALGGVIAFLVGGIAGFIFALMDGAIILLAYKMASSLGVGRSETLVHLEKEVSL